MDEQYPNPRYMDRVTKGVLIDHAKEHLISYDCNYPHDHFQPLKHQLAAAAFNAMMEFYFACLKDEESNG
jgi:hypothetical protein